MLLLLAACERLEASVGSERAPTAQGGVSGNGGAAARCDAAAPLKLYYWNARPQTVTDLIDYLVKIENATGSPVPLETLKIRYYFSNELPPPATLEVYYSDTCCSNKILFNEQVLTSLHSITPRQNADSYFEIGFMPTVGMLAAGDAVQVEFGFHDPDFALALNQGDDYSYSATASGDQLDWDACPGPRCLDSFTSCALTVYRSDALVWGTPP